MEAFVGAFVGLCMLDLLVSRFPLCAALAIGSMYIGVAVAELYLFGYYPMDMINIVLDAYLHLLDTIVALCQ
jgi:hypothetical protein